MAGKSTLETGIWSFGWINPEVARAGVILEAAIGAAATNWRFVRTAAARLSPIVLLQRMAYLVKLQRSD